ncbi:hypothetical protein [Frankia sp. Cr2]|uniref:hypothetical protein n=1 Tax=Frankia sp. Cr2 TaxID=3073932 RepID=UPI002AD38241|nr:hypothetical protein [Frankia sp. Cr2]
MTGGGQVSVTVGIQLAYDRQLWEVSELAGASVLLATSLGTVRQVGTSHLLAHPSTRLLETEEGQPTTSTS